MNLKRLLVLGCLAFGFVAHADDALIIPDIAPITDAAIRAPLVVEKIKKGELSPEEAWQKGELNEDILLFLLNQPGGYLGEQNLLDRAGLVEPFVELFIEKAPDKARHAHGLESGVRYRLADYWFKRKEPRAAPLLKALVEEGAQEFEAKKVLPWYHELSVTRLGEWFHDQREWDKALQLLSDGKALSKNPGYLADWLVLAARIYRAKGESEKAKELYAEVPQYGVSWFTALSYMDQAADLFARGEWEKGQALLQRPVLGSNAEVARFVMKSRLGYSYYQTGEWDKAHFYSQQALEIYKTMKPQEGVDDEMARKTLQEIEFWSQETIVCEPNQLHLLLGQAPLEKSDKFSVTRQFAVLTQEPLPLIVESDSPQVKARFINADKPKRRAYAYERELLVEITPAANKKTWQASLVIQAPGREKFQKRLPLIIEQELPVRLSQPRLYFGFVKAGQKAEQTLKLSALMPFAILKVEPDNAVLRVKPAADAKENKEHTLSFEILANKAGEIHEGRVRLTTNLSQQESIEVPYFAAVE